jgi:hypothetical protein
MKVDTERFNLKKLNEVDGKQQCQIKIPDRFAALEDFDDDVTINSTWGKCYS